MHLLFVGGGSTVVTAVFRLECRFLLVETIVALFEVLLHEWKWSWCGLIMFGHPPLLPWWWLIKFKPLEFSVEDTCTSTCETLWAWGNCLVLTNMAEFSASVLDRWVLVLEIRRVLFIILLSDAYCFSLVSYWLFASVLNLWGLLSLWWFSSTASSLGAPLLWVRLKQRSSFWPR